MKKYLFLIPLALVATLTACKPESGKENDGKKELTIHATIAATKTTVSADGISWNAGDAILVSCDGEAYNFTTAQNGAAVDFTSADGLTQEMVGINPLTAYYGCTQYGAFTIPQNQTISGNLSQTRLPMYAYTATAPEKGEVAMTFTPAASVLEVTVSPAEVTLEKVELAPVDETAVIGNVAGACTVNALTGKVTATGNLKSVSANFATPASLKSGITFRLPVGWFSVTGGMKVILTYNGTETYEDVIWADAPFQSFEGSGDSRSYKYIPVSVEMLIGARDYYVAPDGKAGSKGVRPEDPATLDYALSSADDGSVIHLAAGTYTPVRNLIGDESDLPARKTFEISRNLTLIGEGAYKTILSANGGYHALCVTALPSEGGKVRISGLGITGGDTSASESDAAVTSSVNEGTYSDEYGSGLYVIGSDIELENVKIFGNKGKSAVGGYINKASATLKNVEVSGNTSTANGAGLWTAASKVSLEDCIFTLNNSGTLAAGLYIYAAKEAEAELTAVRCSISENTATSNNAGMYVRGADATAKVKATFKDCIFKKNSGAMGSGFGITYATVLFENCSIVENTSSANGANLVYPGADATFKDCIFRDNKANLAGAIYEYTNADAVKLTVTGCEFSGNSTIAGGRGGAIYTRAAATSATLNVANSTFSGNTGGHFGSAIALYGTASFPVTANIYSCTITGNDCISTNAARGGAIGLETAGLTANIYNTVISGNTWSTTPESADVFVNNANSKANFHKSVIGAATYDESGAAVSAATAFDAATMLTRKTANDKTTVFSLSGASNPAMTYGYDVAGLKGLGASIDGSILEVDQWGNKRSGNVMGAYIE